MPGCSNSIWLDVHHIIYYYVGGLTAAENLITLCSKCHKNVHENLLKIEGTVPCGLRFLNRFGKAIRQDRTLDIAFWLDIWCGWRDSETGRYIRARDASAEGPALKLCA